jgi:integrase
MPVEKPVIDRGQILALVGAVVDLRDLCLLSIGIFGGPRASEVFGLQWKSWTGETLLPQGIAYNGKLYPGRRSRRRAKGRLWYQS